MVLRSITKDTSQEAQCIYIRWGLCYHWPDILDKKLITDEGETVLSQKVSPKADYLHLWVMQGKDGANTDLIAMNMNFFKEVQVRLFETYPKFIK